MSSLVSVTNLYPETLKQKPAKQKPAKQKPAKRQPANQQLAICKAFENIGMTTLYSMLEASSIDALRRCSIALKQTIGKFWQHWAAGLLNELRKMTPKLTLWQFLTFSKHKEIVHRSPQLKDTTKLNPINKLLVQNATESAIKKHNDSIIAEHTECLTREGTIQQVRTAMEQNPQLKLVERWHNTENGKALFLTSSPAGIKIDLHILATPHS